MYGPTVWLLRNLSLDGELCLRDGKNAFFFKLTISCCCRRKLQAVSEWLHLHSLGTMSAFGYIENLA